MSFLSHYCVLFEPLPGSKRACICHDLKNKEEASYVHRREYERNKWCTSDLHIKN